MSVNRIVKNLIFVEVIKTSRIQNDYYFFFDNLSFTRVTRVRQFIVNMCDDVCNLLRYLSLDYHVIVILYWLPVLNVSTMRRIFEYFVFGRHFYLECHHASYLNWVYVFIYQFYVFFLCEPSLCRVFHHRIHITFNNILHLFIHTIISRKLFRQRANRLCKR